jgi:hypothetical protein
VGDGDLALPLRLAELDRSMTYLDAAPRPVVSRSSSPTDDAWNGQPRGVNGSGEVPEVTAPAFRRIAAAKVIDTTGPRNTHGIRASSGFS